MSDNTKPKDVPVLIQAGPQGSQSQIPLSKVTGRSGFSSGAVAPPTVGPIMHAPIPDGPLLPSSVLFSPLEIQAPQETSESEPISEQAKREVLQEAFRRQQAELARQAALQAQALAAERERRKAYFDLAAAIYAKESHMKPEAAFAKAAAFFQYAAQEGIY